MPPKKIENWSLTGLQQRLVKPGARLVTHVRLLLGEGHQARPMSRTPVGGRLNGLEPDVSFVPVQFGATGCKTVVSAEALECMLAGAVFQNGNPGSGDKIVHNLTAIPAASPSVLVVDPELGFLFALSQALHKRNIAVIPCCSVAEAEVLLANLQPDLSVLLINCRCPGVCSFSRELRRRLRLRVVSITSDARQCRQCGEYLDATLRDPDDRRPDGIERCAEIVQAFVRGVKQIYN